MHGFKLNRPSRSILRRSATASLAALMLLASAAPGGVVRPPRIEDSRLEPAPPELRDIGVDEKLGAAVPLDLAFRNERGKVVRLGDYLGRGRPVVLQLAYYDCPMLCSLVAEGMVKSLRGQSIGESGGFDVLTVSIDPGESPSMARQKRANNLRELGRPPGAKGWDFLVGDEKNIRRLADAVGFRYKFVPATDEFSHPAVLTVLTDGGVVSNYLYGVQFDPKVMRAAIDTAGGGGVGTPLEQFIFTCFQVIHSIGQYSGRAMLLMRTAGVLTVLGLGGAIFALVMRERHRAAAADGAEGDLRTEGPR